MPGRVTQHAVESLVQETVKTDVTQYALEALVSHPTASPTTPTGAGVSQYAAEVLISGTEELVRVSQVMVEVLFEDGDVVPVSGGGTTHMWGWAG